MIGFSVTFFQYSTEITANFTCILDLLFPDRNSPKTLRRYLVTKQCEHVINRQNDDFCLFPAPVDSVMYIWLFIQVVSIHTECKMLIQKAYKYRLNPTDAQAQRLRQMCGCAVLSGITPRQRRSVFLRPDKNSLPPLS